MAYRNYMFTLFPLDGGEPLLLLDPATWPPWVTYVIYQREICPETGREHFQGYVELETKKSMVQLHAECEGLETAHFEPRRGSAAQAKAYCSKEASRVEGPWEFGEPKTQGQRADLIALKATIDSGATMVQIADDHFSEFLKFHKSIVTYKRLRQPKRDWPMELILYIGPSGTGKTRAVRDAFPNAYWKPHGKWWDEYDGQETVVFDEMYGSSFPYTELLKLFDRYPHSVECKGATHEFVSRRIVMTSNQEPEDWYDALSTHRMPWLESPLHRRLHEFCRIIRTGAVHRRVPPVVDLTAQLGAPLFEFNHN